MFCLHNLGFFIRIQIASSLIKSEILKLFSDLNKLEAIWILIRKLPLYYHLKVNVCFLITINILHRTRSFS